MAERKRPALGGNGWRGWWTRLAANPAYRWRIRVPIPERLLIAPQDLRTGDPTVAEDIYGGVFSFAGKVVATEGRSPFEIRSPSREWSDTLLGFGWLRHLRSAGLTLSQKNARALITDWISQHGGSHPDSWRPEIVARRVISWLTHAPLILQDADHAFYRAYMRSLSRQVRFLRRVYSAVEDGYPRLLIAIALTFAGLCMSGEQRLLRQSAKRLIDELRRQILPDGGHIGRNPGTLIEILIDLLPLRQIFESRNVPAPAILSSAIDRMIPMLRFFRHTDGALAQFNGMGATPTDMLAAVLAYDEMRGPPLYDANYSGYQRLEASGSVVIADTGTSPPAPVSSEAHAGCLSFEFSTKRNRVVINCGMPALNRDGWREVARATAAHSTVTWHDTSSCRFRMGRNGVPLVAAGPRDVQIARLGREDAIIVRASHDGYVPGFGIVHQRSWRLSPDGDRLDGEDVFTMPRSRDFPPDLADDYVIRFHLHPSVKASRVNDGRTVLLILPGRESWLFTAPNMHVELEESVFLSSSEGPRRTNQIVIADNARTIARVIWTFARADTPEPTRRDPGDDLQLPI
ncbi:MAG: heparinase II/III family protein [Xanthobacteraceae bacterium]|nr:heparinase II/III family protein [Xanthobacteraceae bacterium]MCW5673186.1 heparinase II/III family protein [Xanthobacteraceae bacterium]